MGRLRWLPALAVLAAVPACDRVESLDEAAALLTTGGRIELNDPLRPARGGERVLILALDGVGYDALQQAFREGRLPRLAGALGISGDQAADAVRPMITVLPSITLAAWTTLFTGAPPAETGVPGNEWFDRRVTEFRAPAPVSVVGHEDALATLTEGALGQWSPTPTLFERADVRSYVSVLPVHRGADVLHVPDAEDLADVLGGVAEGLVGDEPIERETYQEFDQASVEEAVGTMEEMGVPDLQVVYFPGVDLYTHVARNPLQSQQEYIAEVLDPVLETLIDAYEEAGAWEGTWVAVVADHGHTPVPADDEHAMGGSGGLDALLDSIGWPARPGELEVEDDTFRSVVAYQGAFAYVYLADPLTCPTLDDACDWSRPAHGADVDRVAQRIRDWAGQDEGTPGARLEMILLPRRDEAGRLTRIDRLGPQGPVPLAQADLPEGGATFRLEERLRWMLDGPLGHRAGDIVLLARSGQWVPEETRFYFSGPYRSWHGSPDPSDSRVGFLLHRVGGGGEGVSVPEDLTHLDFTPLMLQVLGRDSGG